jgi:hypothetical protein
LFIQNDRLKLLIRQGPTTSNEKLVFPSEWTWKLAQINDDQWHSYKIFVNYPDRVKNSVCQSIVFVLFSSFNNKIDLYVDNQLMLPADVDLRIIDDHALSTIDGTGDTIFALGACWHGKID